MNFLLCDTYNVEILPTTDMLQCIIIIYLAEVTGEPHGAVVQFCSIQLFFRLLIISYCFIALLNNYSMLLHRGTYHKP